MIRFEQTYPNCAKVIIEIGDDADITEVLRGFMKFMRACEYNVDELEKDLAQEGWEL